MAARVKAGFVEPMLLLRTDALPDDRTRWEYQLKLDGYRAVAFKAGGNVHLRSRNDNDFAPRYPAILEGLPKLPNETVIDGEVVALDEDGRPSFNALQNHGPAAPIIYFVFDVMVLRGRDVKREPLDARRELLERHVVPQLAEPIRYTGQLDAPPAGSGALGEGARLRRAGREAKRQPLRARAAIGRLAEDADQPRAGVRHRRLHGRHEDRSMRSSSATTRATG